jgi:hypothetical protein
LISSTVASVDASLGAVADDPRQANRRREVKVERRGRRRPVFVFDDDGLRRPFACGWPGAGAGRMVTRSACAQMTAGHSATSAASARASSWLDAIVVRKHSRADPWRS